MASTFPRSVALARAHRGSCFPKRGWSVRWLGVAHRWEWESGPQAEGLRAGVRLSHIFSSHPSPQCLGSEGWNGALPKELPFKHASFKPTDRYADAARGSLCWRRTRLHPPLYPNKFHLSLFLDIWIASKFWQSKSYIIEHHYLNHDCFIFFFMISF